METCYSLECGKNGIITGHNDVFDAEVAQLFWAGVMAEPLITISNRKFVELTSLVTAELRTLNQGTSSLEMDVLENMPLSEYFSWLDDNESSFCNRLLNLRPSI